MAALKTNILKRFEIELEAIVGADMARTLVQFGRSQNPLEAEFLRSDGFATLDEAQRAAVLELIGRYEF